MSILGAREKKTKRWLEDLSELRAKGDMEEGQVWEPRVPFDVLAEARRKEDEQSRGSRDNESDGSDITSAW
jgi:hypothetical protein